MKKLLWVTAVVLMLCLLLSTAVSASSFPGETRSSFSALPVTEVNFLAVAPAGKLFIYSNTVQKLYRSDDGGQSWATYSQSGKTAVALDASPDTDFTVFMATSSTVYRSTNGGATFSALPATGLSGTITSLDVIPAGRGLAVLVGTSTSSLRGGIAILNPGATVWTNLDIRKDVYAVAFSPAYASERAILAVTYSGKQLLLETKIGDHAWNADDSLAALYAGAAPQSATIALPVDYMASSLGMNRVLVGVNGAGVYDDVYRVFGAFTPTPPMINDLNVNGDKYCSVYSLALFGYGMAMVGQPNTNVVRWTEGIYNERVAWSSSPEPPLGVNVDIESFQEQDIYAVTSGPSQGLYYSDPPGFYPLPWPPVAPINLPPANITNLTVSGTTGNSVTLYWTAPGSDGNEGTASAYDIRLRQGSPVTPENWGSASQISGEPAPKPAGSPETFTVTGLAPDTLYYFAIRTADEVPNWSDVSNSVSATTGSEQDSEPPNMISDLNVVQATEHSVTLAWTAPGDDDVVGTASTYDVRYLEGAPVTAANWAYTSPAAGEPPPSPSGTEESFTVTELQPDTLYYFAIRTADEIPNWSDISNSPSAATLPVPDTIPPAPIVDLRVTAATVNSLTLAWTAPGDDDIVGTASTYDIRYLEGTQVQGANWGSANQVPGEPAPLPAGSSQVLTISGLKANTGYYFAMKTADEVPNWSDISNSPMGKTKPVATSTVSTPTTGIEPYNGGSTTTTTTTPTGTTTTTEIPGGSSDVAVTSLTVSKDRAAPGETVKVIATLENTGNEASGYLATLLVNGQVVSTQQIATLAAGSRDIVEFDFLENEPAKYEVQVGERSATVLVSRGINWLKILLFILAVIAAIIILRALIRWAAKKD